EIRGLVSAAASGPIPLPGTDQGDEVSEVMASTAHSRVALGRQAATVAAVVALAVAGLAGGAVTAWLSVATPGTATRDAAVHPSSSQAGLVTATATATSPTGRTTDRKSTRLNSS